MIEILEQCPVCGHGKFEDTLKTKDFSVSYEVFTLQKCKNCHFVLTNPRPDKSSIGKYYQSDEYISHTDKSNSLINILYKLVRNYTLKQKLRLINSHHNDGSILDYGCGTGHFLNICSKNNWNISGIEPDEQARKLAIENTGTEIKSDTSELQNNSFDIITLWHVLEHIHQLNDTLSKLTELLNETGYLIIAVPNLNAYDADIYQEYWAAYDVPRHLYHFTPDTMKLLAEKHGLKLVDTKPMIFDSFYVSMLSEKYKGNKLNLIKPFISACKSNIYAKKTNNYSSLIYILKNDN